MRAVLIWTINDFPAYEMVSGWSTYEMVSGWSTHGKLVCPYCMENNKAFTLTNKAKTFFFTTIDDSCQQIIGTETTKKIFFLAELKMMLYPHVFLVKNCMTWC
jgi:hypothetical protein